VARRRDYAREYAARRRRAERLGLSTSQARGHANANELSLRELQGLPAWTVTFPADDPPRLVTVRTDYRTAQRIGRYDRTLRQLREGRITPDQFTHYARRVKLIGPFKVVSDPRVALALTETATPEDWVFESGRQRPRRARRSK